VPQGLNISDSDSRAIGGMVVRNDVRSTVESFVDAIEIRAYENATIVAFNDGTVTSSCGSAYGSGESLAINGIIATNLVLSNSPGDLSIDANDGGASLFGSVLYAVFESYDYTSKSGIQKLNKNDIKSALNQSMKTMN
jgi:hypothetical protein